MLILPEGTTLGPTDSHRIIPSAEEIPVADAFTGPFDGYALWLATEGRPKSPAKRPLSHLGGALPALCGRRLCAVVWSGG